MIFPVLAVLAGCRNEKYELIIPMSGINVTSPADGSSVDLNDMDLDAVTFSWDQAQEAGATLIFSTSKDLETSVYVDAGAGVSYDMTPTDLNTVASQLGVVAGSSGVLYWTVKASDNMAAAASSVYTITVSRIVSKLKTPADQSVLELLVDEPEAQITFSWDGEGQEGTDYSVLFSMDANMTETGSVDNLITSTSSVSLTADQIQTIIEQFDIARFSQNTIYWNVKNNTSGDYVSRASGVVNIIDMLRFTDIRGENGEEVNQYRVVKLEYNGITQYWLAENFRSAYAADGTSLVPGTEYQVLTENDPSWCSTAEEKADLKAELQAILDEAAADGDLKAAVDAANENRDEDSQLTVSEVSYGADSTTPAEEVRNAADALTDGQVSSVVETDTGFYGIQMISTFDEEATEAEKEAIVQERRDAMYQEQYSALKEQHTFTAVDSVLDKLTFDRVYTLETSEQ